MKTTCTLVAVAFFSLLLCPLAAQDEPSGGYPVDLVKACPGKIKARYNPEDIKDKFTTQFITANKDDVRTDFNSFGLRPTLLIVAESCDVIVRNGNTITNDPKKEKENAATLFRDVADLAKKLEKQKLDVDLWLLTDLHYSTYFFDAQAASKVNTVMIEEDESMREIIPGCVIGKLKYPEKGAAVPKPDAYNSQWLWMEEPGVIKQLGHGFKDKELDELLAAVTKDFGPLLKEKRGQDILKNMGWCQHEKAAKLVSAALTPGKDGKTPAGALAPAIEKRAKLAAGWLQSAIASPALATKYLPEAVEALELAKAYLGKSDEAEKIGKEIDDLKAKPEYPKCVKARKDYQEIKRKVKALMDPGHVGIDYTSETAVRRNREISEGIRAMSPELKRFVEKYPDTPYTPEIQQLVDSFCK